MAKNTYKQDEVLEEPFDIRHLLRASSNIKKYAGRMVVAILLSGIGGAFGYVAPMIIQRALDLAIPDKNEKLLFSLVGMLVGIYVVSVIFPTIRSRIMVDVSQNIIYDIRKDLFEHLQELPFQYYDDRPHGKILIRVVNYVNSVSDMLSNGLINIVLECFNLLFIVIFMFLVDVQMALVVLCGVPVLCVFMVWIKNKQRRAWQAVSNKNSNLNAYLQENIVGARITQIFAREDENAEIFKDLSQDCRRGRCFPEENTISDVILLVNGMICEKIEEGEIVPAADERIFIPREMFTGILESCKELYGRGFIKTYREMTTGEFCENVKNYMLELGLIREEKDIWLSPAVGKVIGKYPEEFMKNGGSDEQ